MKRTILVVDIGGSHVKLLLSPAKKLKFDSGPEMRPGEFAKRFRETTAGVKFTHISIGFPSPVRDGKVIRDPKHLGPGWRRFNFEKALGKPVRVINDAAMQALGSYSSGRMLFLGLGTGLGSALVWDNYVLPLELGDLPYRERRRIEEWLGKPGVERLGKDCWREEVAYAVEQLKLAFIADTVVLGGGNVKKMDRLPRGVKRGDNSNAFLGGRRLWETTRAGELRWQVL
ncbi:MAG: ROK family protein [Verrucomicrobiota bacterium]